MQQSAAASSSCIIKAHNKMLQMLNNRLVRLIVSLY